MTSNLEHNFWTISEDDKTEYCKDSKNKNSEYTIEKSLGSGSFGVTYLAKKSGDDEKLYILKKLTIKNPNYERSYGVKLEDIHSEIEILKTISESESGCVKDLLCYVDHFIDCSNSDSIQMVIITEAFTNSITLYEFININILDIPSRLEDQLGDLKDDLDNLEEELEDYKYEIQDDPDKKQKFRNYFQKHQEKLNKINVQIQRKETQIEEHTRYTPLSHNILLKIMHNILKAIYHLHRLNIGHGDLKPENILINPDTYDVQIIDFGASCVSNDETSLQCITTGTLQYDSPEIIRNLLSGGRKFNISRIKKSDVFSLGAVFYRLGNGKFHYPYEVDDAFKTKETQLAMVSLDNFYKGKGKIFSMYNENQHSIDERINDFIESLLVNEEKRPSSKESLKNLEKIIEEYNMLLNQRRRKNELKVQPDSVANESPIKYTPGILTPKTPIDMTQDAKQNGGKFDKRRAKSPRKWSRAYCKRTSCDKMGFSQRASCRPYKNCYK